MADLPDLLGPLLALLLAIGSVVGGGADTGETPPVDPAPSTETDAPAETRVEAPAASDPAPADTSTATRSLPFVPTDLRADDLGTGSPEFSGVTVNEALNRLLIIEDGGRIFEFALDQAGAVQTPPLRSILVSAGGGDTEGIAWIHDEVYAVMGENFGLIFVADLAGGVTELTPDMVQRSIETGISEDNGKGAEGVSFDRSVLNGADPAAVPGEWVFWAVKEKPATLVRLAADGADTRSGLLPTNITDVSDVFATADGRMFVLSDEKRSVIELDISDDLSSVEVLAQQSMLLGDAMFVQAEGLSFTSDLSRMYVVSEDPGPGQFSYGLFTPLDE